MIQAEKEFAVQKANMIDENKRWKQEKIDTEKQLVQARDFAKNASKNAEERMKTQVETWQKKYNEQGKENKKQLVRVIEADKKVATLESKLKAVGSKFISLQNMDKQSKLSKPSIKRIDTLESRDDDQNSFIMMSTPRSIKSSKKGLKIDLPKQG